MRKQTRIFVCGIAGVGKSYLLSRAQATIPDSKVFRASEIIGLARQNLDGEFLRNLPHDQMEASQLLLVAGFNQRMLSCTEKLVFLDGHSVIDNDHGMFPVRSSVLTDIQLDTIIHIEDDVRRIQERRTKDFARPRPARTLDQLELYQKLSIATCEEISRALSIPLQRVLAEDELALLDQLRSL